MLGSEMAWERRGIARYGMKRIVMRQVNGSETAHASKVQCTSVSDGAVLPGCGETSKDSLASRTPCLLYETRYNIARAHHEIDFLDVLKLSILRQILLIPRRLYQRPNFHETVQMRPRLRSRV
jgi:hypothetical protein